MRFNKKSYKSFTHEEAVKWGKQNYSNWLTELQNADYSPQTPLEQFFRSYTQGIHYVFNRSLRYYGIDKYDFEDSCISKSMIVDSIDEINKHKLCEDVIVYRYISRDILRCMKRWSNVRLIRKNSVLTDKGYFSTTLSLESVQTRDYATLKDKSLFIIYVPKGTPCVYVDLISEMDENELIFAPNIKLKVLSSQLFGKFIECVVINE